MRTADSSRQNDDGEQRPRVRRRTIGDKLLLFAKRTLLGVVATLIVGWLIVLVAAPIVVRGKISMPAEPAIAAVEPSDVPGELRDLHRRLLENLTGEGFEDAGWLRTDDMPPGTVTFLGLARNDEERVMGLAAGIARATDTGFSLDTSYHELSTELADGREVGSNNSSARRTFHPRPDLLIESFVDVDDPLELYRLHLDRLRRLGTVARSPLPAPEELIASLGRDMVAELDGQVAEGYFFLDAASATYRMTWKGAIIMTWKHIWPLSLVL